MNLSDLAAMGAEPRLCLLSLALPASLPIADFDGIAGGITALAARHRLHVAGGNLTRSPGPLVIDITVVGTVKRRQVLRRSGARPGDDLYVSGAIGAAAAGLGMLKASGSASCTGENPCAARYLYPEPRLRLGLLVARTQAAHAGMDLSDGLADGVHQLAEAGGVGAIVDADALPVEPAARAWFEQHGEDAVSAALTGGDDYELLLAVHPKAGRRLAEARRHGGGVALTKIGVCTEDPAVLLKRRDTEAEPLPKGFHHFR